MIDSMGKRRRRRQAEEHWGQDEWEEEDLDLEDWDMGDDFQEGFDDVADFSVTSSYPQPYCKRIEDLKTQCFQESLLELWANKGVFDAVSDATIAGLTKHSILEKINGGNYRYVARELSLLLLHILMYFIASFT